MLIFLLLATGAWAYPAQDVDQDGPSSRKILGSSVVTSVSVIMDNGAETHFSDAVGRPMSKPPANSQVASPINLLNPDRYEFYTFDDSGDLVKRLMTLEEIQGIIANGDGDAFNYNSNSPTLPEKKVNDVVSNVQNVLKGEMEIHRNTTYPENLDTPDVGASWSMILPAIFGNSGEQIKPSKPQGVMTPDTITVEQDVIIPAPVVNKPMPFTPSENSLNDNLSESTTEYKESTSPKITKVPAPILTTTQNIDTPIITVSINTNNQVQEDTDKIVKGTTKRPPLPTLNDIEAVKDNFERVTVKKPAAKPSTFRPPSTYKTPSVISRRPIISSTIALPSSTMVKISSTATTAMRPSSTNIDSTSTTERLTTITTTTEKLRTTTQEPTTTTSTTQQPRTTTTELPRTTTTEQPRTTTTTTTTTEQPRTTTTTTTEQPRTTTTPVATTSTTSAPRTTTLTPKTTITTTTSAPRTITTSTPRTTTTTTSAPRTTTTSTARTTITTTSAPRTTTTSTPTTTTTLAPKTTTATPTPQTTTTTTFAPRTTTTTTPSPPTTSTTTSAPVTSKSTSTVRIPSSSTTFTNYEASPSQFIQIFDSASTTPNINKQEEIKLEEPIHKVQLQNVDLKPPSNSLSAPEFISTVFIFDHKTNTKIPITTKEQLTTLLDILPNESTTEMLKGSATNNYLQEFTDKFTTYNNYVDSTTNTQAQTESESTKVETSATTESISQSLNKTPIISVESMTDKIDVSQNTNHAESSTLKTENLETANIPDSTEKFLISTSENISDNLPVIQDTSSEFIKIAGTIEKLPESTTLQKLFDSTDKLNTDETKLAQSTERLPESTEIDLISVPEILDQLLLTSTNIYEINTELGNQVTDSVHQTTEKLTVGNTEVIKDSETTPKYVQTTEKVEEVTEVPTTERNIINSIEQLLQQAIDDSNGEETSNDEVSNKPNEEITTLSTVAQESTTTDDMDEIGNFKNEEIRLDGTTETAEVSTLEATTEEPQSDLINDSVSSLLSQVISSAQEALTTLEDFQTTTEIPDAKTTELIKENTEAVKLETVAETQTQTETIKPTEFTTFVPNTSDEIKEETSTRFEISSLPSETTTLLESFTETQKLNEDIKQDESEILNTEATSYVKKDFTTQTQGEISTDKPEELSIITDNVLNTSTLKFVPTTEEISEKTIVPIIDNDKHTTVLIITRATTHNYEGVKNITTMTSTTQTPVLKPVVKKEDSNWSLVPTIVPHQNTTSIHNEAKPQIPMQPTKPVVLNPQTGFGLEDSNKNLDADIYQFVNLCNELAFGFWTSVTNGISTARSVFVSPFAATSLLAMVFLGARGATSGEMNEILKLDDMITFNPHLIFRNVTESIEASNKSGVATSIILRELYSDKSKGLLLSFYKERAKQFYDGHVEEVSFKEVGDVVRKRTNLIVKRLSKGKIPEYIKDSSITVKSPLAGVSVSIFQTDCSEASTEGRDGELYFIVLPSIRQRRLIPVPAAVWRSGFLAGYEPGLDATAVSIGGNDQTISTIFVIPGQQGIAAPGDGLSRLERHLVSSSFKDGSWSRLLRSLIPRPGLEVQIPRFAHKSIINATVALQHMGMKDLFDSSKADLRGLNGVANDLYLSDILQINSFATCGEDTISSTHHSEIYPATANRTYRRSRKFKDVLQPEDAYYDSELLEEPRDYQRAFHDPLHDPKLFSLPLPLRPRQARLPDAPRLRFDRPFLYFIRHNPTGLILHMGRFNPRLLP